MKKLVMVLLVSIIASFSTTAMAGGDGQLGGGGYTDGQLGGGGYTDGQLGGGGDTDGQLGGGGDDMREEG